MANGYFGVAVAGAKRFRDEVFASSVRVDLAILGPDNQTRVPCGTANFTRCDYEIQEPGELLVITSIDDGAIVRSYVPEQWLEVTKHGPDGRVVSAVARKTVLA